MSGHLKRELNADIQDSANEAARFRNALDVQVVAERKRKAYCGEGEAELTLSTRSSPWRTPRSNRAGRARADAVARELEQRLKLEQAPKARTAIDAAVVFDPVHELLEVD